MQLKSDFKRSGSQRSLSYSPSYISQSRRQLPVEDVQRQLLESQLQSALDWMRMIETTETNLPAIIVTFLQTPHERDFTADTVAHIARNRKISIEMSSRIVESCLL